MEFCGLLNVGIIFFSLSNLLFLVPIFLANPILSQFYSKIIDFLPEF